jgi:2-methylcitrate dehydratase PrpD
MAQTQTAISPEIRKLGLYMASATRRKLPPKVVEKAKLHILDTLAAMVSGSRLPPGLRALDYMGRLQGHAEAGVIGTALSLSAADAAFANGMFAHADETDDSHRSSHTHPGSAVVPAALAAAQKTRATGTQFLRSVVLGYDVCCRLTKALDVHSFQESERSIHSFGGIFGAGAAAGALFKFDGRQMRHLLSYVAQSAGGCGAYFYESEHTQKAFVYSGRTAQDGVRAAELVCAGFPGVEDIFSGDRNFLNAYATKQRPAELSADLGRRYEVMGAYIKKWSVGSPIQAVLDGVDFLIANHGVRGTEVDAITLHMTPRDIRTVSDRTIPDVCVQHQVALMLVDGGSTFASIHDEARMKDARVLAVRRRINLKPTPSLVHSYLRRAVVEIRTRDGRTLKKRIDKVRGSTANPMSRDEVVAKAHDLIDGILGRRKATRLVDAVLNLEKLGDASRLRGLLAADTPRRR